MFRLAALALVGLAIAVGDAASVRASIAAMRCCIKTHGDCAGVRTPDDCCRGMGHAAVGPTSGTPPTKSTVNSPFLHAVAAWTTMASDPTPAHAPDSISFKRPHDPPHLHSFSLLI